MSGRVRWIDLEGRRTRVSLARTRRGGWVGWPGHSVFIENEEASNSSQLGDDRIVAPMTGKVLKVTAEVGQTVAVDDPLVVLEAMKMEYRLVAPHPGAVTEVHCDEGDLVELGAVLVTLEKS